MPFRLMFMFAGAVLIHSSVYAASSGLEFLNDTDDIESKRPVSKNKSIFSKNATVVKELEFLNVTEDNESKGLGKENVNAIVELGFLNHTDDNKFKKPELINVTWPYKNTWYLKQFVSYHCWRLKHFCKPGGPEICAFEPNVKQYIRCADMCTFHKINCGEMIGYYKPVNLSECPEGTQFVNTNYNPYLFKISTTSRIILPNETITWEPPTQNNVESKLQLFKTAIHHFLTIVSNFTIFKPI